MEIVILYILTENDWVEESNTCVRGEIKLEMDPEPLLTANDTPVDGVVDIHGRPVTHSNSGGWKSALFIIVVEMAERFAYYGVSMNLITYLTGPLGESTAVAAANVNAWSGLCAMLPLPLGLVADKWLGRYRTVIIASALYVLGLGMLTFSAVSPQLQPAKRSDGTSYPPTSFQSGFFFFSIYMVSLAQGGHKPCVQAFGADQFDENDIMERRFMSSFFNWWYFGLCLAVAFTICCLSYVQDNIGWGAGFGIPGLSMALALLVFLLGTKTYRFPARKKESPFENIGSKAQPFIGGNQSPLISSVERGTSSVVLDDQQHERPKLFLTQTDSIYTCIMRLFPIWVTCLIYAVVYTQSSTFFTKQGSTMDGRIGPSFQVPPAALQSFISISIVVLVPLYERILVPVTRKFTGKPSGISMLQRIGIGIFLSVISMVVAAAVEIKRLKTVKDYGLIDMPGEMVPMSLWWLAPQYILYGISDVFAMIGLQEFFYDQVPDGYRSLGLALYLSIFGIGSFISSALVSIIDKITSDGGGESWFSDNLNHAHLDYFYFLLAGLSTVQLLLYVFFSRCYVYKNNGRVN